MSFVFFYIFISLVVFLILAYYIFILWNPDISKLFKNEKIKTYLFDRYWLYKNKKNIKKKNIFIVIGSKTNEHFNNLIEIENEQNEELSKISFNGQINPFEIINIQSVNYIFINEELFIENKETGDTQILRIIKNINSILKLRKYNTLDGVIFFPNQNAFHKNVLNFKELSEEAQIYSKLFKMICHKLKSKIPIFFIENSDFNDIPPFHSVPSSNGDEEIPNFGFAHSSLENTEELNKEIKKAIESCIGSYEIQSQYYLQNLEDKAQVKAIRFFYNLKSGIISFSKNYVDYFYKGFSFKNKRLTNFHYILNLSSFYKSHEFDDNNSNLFNMFKHLSNNLINGSNISKEFIKNKIRNRVILGIITLFHFIFVSYAIFSSSNFLQEKRGVFLKSFSELNNFINGYKKFEHTAENIDIMQTKICSLINNSNTLATTSFYYPLLYPSWNSNIDKTFSQKYDLNLANFISKILIQNFNEKVSNHLLINKSTDNISINYDEILQKTILFIEENGKINQIYSLLNDSSQIKNTDGLAQMANFLYGIDCGKTLAERKVFSSLNTKNVTNLVNPNYSVFKSQSNDILKNLIQFYFQNFAKNNDIIIAAKKVESDLLSIKDLDNTDKQMQDIPFSQKLIADLNFLQNSLLKNQESLKSASSFYGPNFLALLKDLEKNSLFGKESATNILTLANEQFEQFKSTIGSITPLGASFPIIINNSGVLSLNPQLNQMSLALSKMDGAFNNNSTINQTVSENKQFSSDLKFIAMNLPTNALWEIDTLQSNLQKGIVFSSAASSVNQAQLPEALSVFFSRLSNSMSSLFWKKNLPTSLKIFNVSTQNPDLTTQQIDSNIQNIQMSVPILKSISEQLLLYGQSEINTNLSSIVSQQIDRQIKKYSNILNASLFFSPIYPDFLWWSGDTSPAFNAFGVTSDEDLKLYINNQKIAVDQFYNKNIQPILQSRSLFFKDLTSYHTDKSLDNLLLLQDALSPTPKTNSFAALSGFITATMSPLRTEGCQKFISQPPQLSNKDFFSIKLNGIYTPLANRCQSLLIKQAYSNYDKFAFQFNTALSGKFPFQTNSFTTDSASIEDMNTVFNSFAQLQKQDIPILKKYSALYRGRPEIQNFIQNMVDLQNFFTPQNDKDGNPSPTKWNVEFDFRTNTDKEILGNQIINWSLQSGNDIIGSEQGNGSKAKIVWTYADPIQFSVTLAQSSKYSLDKFSEDKNIFITNNTIYFNIRNRWSLLKFINDYADCGNSNFCLKNTLKFELPINNDQKVKFYVSLFLKNSKGMRVYVPKFPTSAPYIEKKGMKQTTSDNFE